MGGDNELHTPMKDNNILKDDQNLEISFKRSKFLPRIIDDLREERIVKAYIRTRFNGEIVNVWYRILSSDSLAGERPRSLFITTAGGHEVVYKMVRCETVNGCQKMTFQKVEES